MRLSFSPQSIADLESISDYIARDNPKRAVSFVAEIKARCVLIPEMPRAAPRRDDLLPGMRMVPFKRYLIFYTLSDDEARIERILHGARDLGEIF